MKTEWMAKEVYEDTIKQAFKELRQHHHVYARMNASEREVKRNYRENEYQNGYVYYEELSERGIAKRKGAIPLHGDADKRRVKDVLRAYGITVTSSDDDALLTWWMYPEWYDFTIRRFTTDDTGLKKEYYEAYQKLSREYRPIIIAFTKYERGEQVSFKYGHDEGTFGFHGDTADGVLRKPTYFASKEEAAKEISFFLGSGQCATIRAKTSEIATDFVGQDAMNDRLNEIKDRLEEDA